MISYMQLHKSETLILSLMEYNINDVENEITRESVNYFDHASDQMTMCGYSFQGNRSDDWKQGCYIIKLLRLLWAIYVSQIGL